MTQSNDGGYFSGLTGIVSGLGNLATTVGNSYDQTKTAFDGSPLPTAQTITPINTGGSSRTDLGDNSITSIAIVAGGVAALGLLAVLVFKK